MAAALYLVTKAESEKPQNTIINGIHACIVNSDDGGTAAQKIAEATAAIQGLGHDIPDDYFDTVELLGLPTGGIMATDEDTIVILPRGTDRDIT